MIALWQIFTKTVGRKILTVVGITGIVSLTTLGVVMVREMKASLLASNDVHIQQLTETASRGLQTIMLGGYADIARNYADNLKEILGLESFKILRTDGSEAFQRSGDDDEEVSPKPPPPLPDDADPRFAQAVRTLTPVTYTGLDAEGRSIKTLLVPLENSEGCQACHGEGHRVRGVFEIVVSLAPVEKVIAEAQMNSLVLIATAVTLFLALLGFVLRHVVNGPLKGINVAVQKMASGDLTSQVAVLKSRDEVAEISRNVNVLTDNLVGNIRTINLQSGSITAFISELLKLRGEMEKDASEVENIAQEVAEKNRALTNEINIIQTNVTQSVGQVATIQGEADKVAGFIGGVASAADQSSKDAVSMADAARQMSTDVHHVNTRLETVGASVAVVSNAVVRMTDSLEGINDRCRTARQESDQASQFAREAIDVMRELINSAKEIDQVVVLINDIAGQTSMLALNAAIEAAGAGESGKGFAVVAREVKELARQTGEATEPIVERIQRIQDHSTAASEAVGKIAHIVQRISVSNLHIATDVDGQLVLVREIGRSIGAVTTATQEVDLLTDGLAKASEEVSSSAHNSATKAEEISSSTADGFEAARQMAEGSRASRALMDSVRGAADTTQEMSIVVKGQIDQLMDVLVRMQGTVNRFRGMADIANHLGDALLASHSCIDIGDESFDIRLMKESVFALLGRLDKVLSGRENLTQEEASQCALCEWLQDVQWSPAQESLGVKIVEVHALFHRSAQEIVSLVEQRHDLSRGMEASRFILQVRRTLFDLLDHLYLGHAEEFISGDLIEWSAEIETGVLRIDTDHKQLVAQINQLNEAIQKGEGGRAVGAVLDKLVDYFRVHFEVEEEIMKGSDYPHVESHVEEHRWFVEKVETFRDRHRKESFALSGNVLNFLQTWLVKHILQVDKKMVKYLK